MTQTLAWGSSYYLPAILADPIAAGLGVPKSLFFGFFSGSLLLQAALGPAIGKAIDRHGGRGVLVLSNLVLGARAAMAGLRTRAGRPGRRLGVLGIGMALGLYDAAFATLTALYGREARGPITGITLIAGFASTVGWPLSALLNDSFRLARRLPRLGGAQPPRLPADQPLSHSAARRPAHPAPPRDPAVAPPANGMAVLAFVFGAVGFVTGAMAAHLPRLLEMSGATATAAIAAASLMGPAQVAARLFEFGVLKRLHPLVSTRLALLMHPLGAAVLGIAGAPAAAAFALFHGAGNGLLTISRGTLPLALFGPAGYGLRTGIIAAPARVTTAAAPLLFGLLLNAMGTGGVARLGRAEPRSAGFAGPVAGAARRGA